MLEIFSNAIFCSLKCPSLQTNYFFKNSIFALKTAPVLRFPAFRLLWRAPVLRFLAFGSKIDQDSAQSCPQMLGNEALVPFTEPEMLGNEALGAVLMHTLEKTLENPQFSWLSYKNPIWPLKSSTWKPYWALRALKCCMPASHLMASLKRPSIISAATSTSSQERLLGGLRQSVPQNGRVQLHTLRL